MIGAVNSDDTHQVDARNGVKFREQIRKYVRHEYNGTGTVCCTVYQLLSKDNLVLQHESYSMDTSQSNELSSLDYDRL